MRASPHDRDDAHPRTAAQRSPRNRAGRRVLGERERGMLCSVMMERACSVACARRQGRERTRVWGTLPASNAPPPPPNPTSEFRFWSESVLVGPMSGSDRDRWMAAAPPKKQRVQTAHWVGVEVRHAAGPAGWQEAAAAAVDDRFTQKSPSRLHGVDGVCVFGQARGEGSVLVLLFSVTGTMRRHQQEYSRRRRWPDGSMTRLWRARRGAARSVRVGVPRQETRQRQDRLPVLVTRTTLACARGVGLSSAGPGGLPSCRGWPRPGNRHFIRGLGRSEAWDANGLGR